MSAGNTERGRCYKTRVMDDQILYDHRFRATIQMQQAARGIDHGLKLYKQRTVMYPNTYKRLAARVNPGEAER